MLIMATQWIMKVETLRATCLRWGVASGEHQIVMDPVSGVGSHDILKMPD